MNLIKGTLIDRTAARGCIKTDIVGPTNTDYKVIQEFPDKA